MLYNEFLEGTKAPENLYTYNEYKRIERIYNYNENMSKEEAYKLYVEPDALTKALLAEIEKYAYEAVEAKSQAIKAQKEVEEYREKLESKEAIIRSLNLTLQQCLKESEIATSRISNLIYG